jgi:hypothetical protein
MAQTVKKFIGTNQVDETKILLNNAAFLKALKADGVTSQNLLGLDSGNLLQFSLLPQLPADATSANDAVRYSFLESYVAAHAALPTGSASINVSVSGVVSAIVDGITLKTGSSGLEAGQSASDVHSLTSGEITGQAFLLSKLPIGQAILSVSGVVQTPGVDYSVGVSGSVGMVSLLSSGDLGTGRPAALVASDVCVVNYDYLP